jgi:nifR3 family TIM-barrel protein
MKGFWGTVSRPFFVLAPMADVTDAAFRRIIAKYSKVPGGVPPASPQTSSRGGYVTYTEFVSADGLARAPEEGRNKLMQDLAYSEAERPIVAQFFTSTPAYMEGAAKLAEELGFDGVDINMGCPADAVVRQGAGAELIKRPELASELIAAAKQGAPTLPVSVKTRLGYNTDTLEEWLPALLRAEPAAVVIHARTRKEMSAVPARWERIARAVEIRNELGSDVYIAGNGDLQNVADAKEKIAATGADGAMLGRAIFGNPWLFAADTTPSLEARLRVAVEHTKLFEELLGDVKNFALMKKHFKAYAEGFVGAKELRVRLMETSNAQEIEKIIEDFIKQGVH